MSRTVATAALYDCRVVHRRHLAPALRFRYRLLYLLVDIDQIEALSRSLWLFSYNRFNLFSLHDRDHGGRRPGALRAWAEDALRAAGIVPDGGRIRLLCLPRLLGYAFNPLSLWYCEARDGRLRAVIAEVRNTFGERHSYVLERGGAAIDWLQPIAKDKVFHVSPFLDLRGGRYRFRLEAPGERLRVAIHETLHGAAVLDAGMAGERRALSSGALLRALLGMPWMTVKVVVAIHWQALRLFLRRAPFYPKPLPPSSEIS
ncbi:DUF1365 domain-containing protein [Solimonas soli]|uniref:DUF1365 domain-containing protein n=1 Tax=Solimonas soli TaxID=413479 RepID=UPI00048599ED|nr:DUF1365 domain-containing protein [Solimonas soli]